MPFRSTLPAAAAIVLALGAAASAYPKDAHHNPLDDGIPIASAWTATGDFVSLGALGPDAVRFTTGDNWRVRAEGDPRTLERLRFVIEDGRLLVGRRSGEDARLPAAMIYVTAPGIRSATLAGSGQVDVDRLTGEAVSATVAGSGDLSVGAVSSHTLKGSVAGSGDLSVRGHSEDASLVIAGSGRFDGSAFSAERASAMIAGSGGIAFRSDGTVKATITGNGSVTVSGRASCSQTRIGSGSLRCARDRPTRR
jgi:hypothetical protein